MSLVRNQEKVWPKTHDTASASVARSLARVCVGARDAFPEALQDARTWLRPLTFPEPVVGRLHELNIPGRFPEQSLEFLHLVIGARHFHPETFQLA